VILYFSAASCIKLSISIFLLRICPKTAAMLFRTLIISAAVILLSWIGSVFQIAFLCKPSAAAFNLNVKLFQDYQCASPWKAVLGWGVVYIVTDVWLVLLPIKILWNVHLPSEKKWGTNLILACGAVAAVATIAKTIFLRNGFDSWDTSCKAASNLFSSNADRIGSFVIVLILSQLEITLGLIAASLPALGFLLIPLFSVFSQYCSEILSRGRRVYGRDMSNSNSLTMAPEKQPSGSPSTGSVNKQTAYPDAIWKDVGNTPPYYSRHNEETFYRTQTSGFSQEYKETFPVDGSDRCSVDLVIQKPPSTYHTQTRSYTNV
jgi:hypothetical protein